jgi:hypothetical protein
MQIVHGDIVVLETSAGYRLGLEHTRGGSVMATAVHDLVSEALKLAGCTACSWQV